MAAAADGVAAAAFRTVGGVPVRFSEDWSAGIGGGLWSTGLAMAAYFDEHAADIVADLERLRAPPEGSDRRGDVAAEGGGIAALELGAGNGFLSVCLLALALRHGALIKELVVSDTAEHLDLITKTLMANSHVWKELIVAEPCDPTGAERVQQYATPPSDAQRRGNAATVVVVEHLWGNFPPVQNPVDATTSEKFNIDKKYDFIFGTDLAYRDELHAPLIATLARCSHPRTVCLVGVTAADTPPAFFDALEAAGFRYERLAEHLLGREYRGRDFGIIAIQRR